jgi:hypothetical protein
VRCVYNLQFYTSHIFVLILLTASFQGAHLIAAVIKVFRFFCSFANGEKQKKTFGRMLNVVGEKDCELLQVTSA